MFTPLARARTHIFFLQIRNRHVEIDGDPKDGLWIQSVTNVRLNVIDPVLRTGLKNGFSLNFRILDVAAVLIILVLVGYIRFPLPMDVLSLRT